ncbi:MAG: TIGR00730 family Rossman fold protein [Planctomycetaceae bacterium]
MSAICVFCGSRTGLHDTAASAAEELARLLIRRQHRLVYGGGSVGLMGAIADEMLKNSGDVIGVIPESLASVELMHSRVDDMRIVPDMHARKALMHELSDAYIALPGGYGTMEELFEVLSWAQLKIHTRPIALLNLNGLYDGLITTIDNMVEQQFLPSKYRSLLTVCDTIAMLDDWLENCVGVRHEDASTPAGVF